ncbi:hypothetical protein BC826DRAFT_410423 [Russula brevipes]|nr:hypothetical protein BC826DRAFT_410423 [Russula brevipes]
MPVTGLVLMSSLHGVAVGTPVFQLSSGVLPAAGRRRNSRAWPRSVSRAINILLQSRFLPVYCYIGPFHLLVLYAAKPGSATKCALYWFSMLRSTGTLPNPRLCTSALAPAAHNQSLDSRRLGISIRVKNALLCDVASIAHQMLNGGWRDSGGPAWPSMDPPRRRLLSATTLPSEGTRWAPECQHQRNSRAPSFMSCAGEGDVAGMKSGANLCAGTLAECVMFTFILSKCPPPISTTQWSSGWRVSRKDSRGFAFCSPNVQCPAYRIGACNRRIVHFGGFVGENFIILCWA